MPSSHILNIPVQVDFHGSQSSQPAVGNSPNQSNEVSSSVGKLQWTLQAFVDGTPVTPHNGLEVTGVSFFSDSAKSTPVSPPYLDLPGSAQGPLHWVINFNDTPVSQQQTLYYELHYQTDDFPDQAWDPSLTIDPRGG